MNCGLGLGCLAANDFRPVARRTVRGETDDAGAMGAARAADMDGGPAMEGDSALAMM